MNAERTAGPECGLCRYRPESHKWLSLAEAAEEFGFSARELGLLAQNGQISFGQPFGKLMFVRWLLEMELRERFLISAGGGSPRLLEGQRAATKKQQRQLDPDSLPGFYVQAPELLPADSERGQRTEGGEWAPETI